MSVLFNQAEADAEVINNLMKEIRRLTPMPLFQLKDGTFIRTKEFEVVSTEEVSAERLELIDRLSVMNDMLGLPVNQDGSTNGEQTPVPAADQATPQNQQIAPAPADVDTPQPEFNPSPAVDPNTAIPAPAEPAIPTIQ